MIERYVRDYLRSVAAISNRVDGGANYPGIYAGNAPQGHEGECLIMQGINSDHNYSLTGEVADRESIVQITAYSNTASTAYSLAELVRNRMSGYKGMMGDNDETNVKTCIIQTDVGADIEETADADDKFIHSYTVDYLLIHTTPTPTLA
jgi:hypothetical protein